MHGLLVNAQYFIMFEWRKREGGRGEDFHFLTGSLGQFKMFMKMNKEL